jgi:hypothetical protein
MPGAIGGVGDPADAAQDELEDLLPVHRVVQGLPHTHVVEGWALGVEVDVDGPEARGAHHLNRPVGLEAGNILGRDAHGHVGLPRLYQGYPGGAFGHGDEAHLGDGGFGTPVVLVAHQVHELPLLPRLEPVGPGAHGVVPVLGSEAPYGRGALHGGGAMGQVGQKGGEGVLEAQAHGVAVHHLHPLQLGEEEGEGARQLPGDKALQVELDGLGVEGGAVVEGDAPAEPYGEGPAPIGEAVPLGQMGDDLALRGQLKEGLADVGDHGGRGGVRGQGGIQGGGVGTLGHHQPLGQGPRQD